MDYCRDLIFDLHATWIILIIYIYIYLTRPRRKILQMMEGVSGGGDLLLFILANMRKRPIVRKKYKTMIRQEEEAAS